MILKKFYAPSIKEARQQAAGQFGEAYIVLETKDASDERPACITVLPDKPLDENRKAESGDENPEIFAAKGTYSRKNSAPKNFSGTKESGNSALSRLALTLEDEQNQPGHTRGDTETLTMSRRSTSIYDGKPGGLSSEKNTPKISDFPLRESAASKEVKALHRRFDRMESLLSDALISANLEYVSHPAFQQLLNTGMQAPTVSRWFEQILNKGIDPYEQHKSFMFELGDIVRSTLSFALPEAAEKNLLFVGPSGAGKTTLIMKLASNPDFMQGKNIALVSVEPENSFRRYSMLELFAKDTGLAFYKIKNGIDAGKLLPQLEDFDHVLFDTPSLSLQKEAAFRDFWHIRQILSTISPLEVHYVVNATLQRYYFKESYAANHPLQPDYVAITHLDETDKWGHLLPFMQANGCTMRYVSRGPNVPDDIQLFKPAWFAEHILSHS